MNLNPSEQDAKYMQAQKRVMDKLAMQELDLMRQEQAAAEQREEQAWNVVYSEQAEVEAQAVKQMRELAAKRNELRARAEKAIKAISEFYAMDAELQQQMKEIKAPVMQYWKRTVQPILRDEKWATLRESAGLDRASNVIGVSFSQSELIGATAIRAITNGNLKPGFLDFGSKLLPFNFEDGV